jgi:hypothetical protein
VAAHAGHFEVEENKCREGKLDAVLVLACADEISDGFLGRADEIDWIEKLGLSEATAEKGGIIVIVLDNEE